MLKALGKMFATIVGAIVGGILAIVIVLWLLSLLFVKAVERMPTEPVRTIQATASK